MSDVQPDATENDASGTPPKHASGNIPRTLGTIPVVAMPVPVFSRCVNCGVLVAAPITRTIAALTLPVLGNANDTDAGSPLAAILKKSAEPKPVVLCESVVHPEGAVAFT